MVVCPICNKEYEPELGERNLSGLIQDEFPDAKPYQREQLQTGICSDECWELSMTEPDEDSPLISPPFSCIFRADDPVKFETCLYVLETIDHAANHRRQDDLFMIFGMGELHLEVIRYKLENEFGLSFKLVRKTSVVLLEPWSLIRVECPNDKNYISVVSDELERRRVELDEAIKVTVFEGVMSAFQTIGMFDKLRELTDSTASVSTEFCDYRVKLDWTLSSGD